MSVYLDGTDLRSRAEAAEAKALEAACRVEDLARRLAAAEALADRLGEALKTYAAMTDGGIAQAALAEWLRARGGKKG